MILLWDVDEGLEKIDRYFESNDNDVTAGALLAVGIVTCGKKSENEPVSFPLMSSRRYEYLGTSIKLLMSQMIVDCKMQQFSHNGAI